MASENMANDISRTAKNAASTAVSAAKAAGKAASGNFAGAAIDVAKNESLRKIVLVITITSIVLILYICALPAIMFGSVISWVDDTDSEAKNLDTASYVYAVSNIPDYSDEHGGIYQESRTNSIWGFIKSIFRGRESGDQKLKLDDNAFMITGSEESAKSSLTDRINMVKEQFAEREVQYRSMLSDMTSYFRSNPPADVPPCDEFNVTGSYHAPEFSNLYAIMVMSAYSVQNNNGTEETDASSLSSWIGYYKNSAAWKTDEYYVKGASFKTTKWKGDFLPQYLYEQRDQAKEQLGYNEQYYENLAESFLSKIYFVDKASGIKTNYAVTETTKDVVVDGVATTIPWTIVTMEIDMYATLLGTTSVADTVVGFWNGDFSDAQSGGSLTTIEWTDEGKTYTRQMPYQKNYFSDMQGYVRSFLGIEGANPETTFGAGSFVINGENINATAISRNIDSLLAEAECVGVDTATPIRDFETAQALKESGVSFVGRYLVPKRFRKALTKEEAQVLSAAGLDIFVYFEIDVGDAMGGATAGAKHGQMAYECAVEVGLPKDAVIYFTCDTDPAYPYGVQHTCDKYIIPYIKAAKEQLKGEYKIGYYAAGSAIQYINDTDPSLCDAFVQSIGWSYGYVADAYTIYQATNSTTHCGISVDWCTCRDADKAGFFRVS